jgi:hypothetical protein
VRAEEVRPSGRRGNRFAGQCVGIRRRRTGGLALSNGQIWP